MAALGTLKGRILTQIAGLWAVVMQAGKQGRQADYVGIKPRHSHNARAERVNSLELGMLADVHADGNLVTAHHPYVLPAFMNTVNGN